MSINCQGPFGTKLQGRELIFQTETFKIVFKLEKRIKQQTSPFLIHSSELKQFSVAISLFTLKLSHSLIFFRKFIRGKQFFPLSTQNCVRIVNSVAPFDCYIAGRLRIAHSSIDYQSSPELFDVKNDSIRRTPNVFISYDVEH